MLWFDVIWSPFLQTETSLESVVLWICTEGERGLSADLLLHSRRYSFTRLVLSDFFFIVQSVCVSLHVIVDVSLCRLPRYVICRNVGNHKTQRYVCVCEREKERESEKASAHVSSYLFCVRCFKLQCVL